MNQEAPTYTHIDFIGDIHGHADKLRLLLERLGYIEINGVYGHPYRRAHFVGDLIDRGRQNVETITIVRRMVENGYAEMVMGNHELNAIAWFYGAREHSEKNRRQHAAFLDEVENTPQHREIIEWMEKLPLAIEREGFRLVHAFYHDESIRLIEESGHGIRDILTGEGERFDALNDAIELLTKGPELALPEQVVVKDGHGHQRSNARVRWWNKGADRWDNLIITNGLDVTGEFPDEPVTGAIPEHSDDRPIFFGHYWMEGIPLILGLKHACVDFSVANGGTLAAYRWDGESELSNDRMFHVPKKEPSYLL